MKKTEKRILRPWVIYALVIILTIFIVGGINLILQNDIKQHIEKVSEKCAEKGYGIKEFNTKDGDTFYACNK